MFVASYLEVAEHLVQQYALQMPLYLYLKEFFKQNKKFGSRDRKMISELVFGFYRIAPEQGLERREQILLGSYLSGRLPLLFFEKTNRLLATDYEEGFSIKWNHLQSQQQLLKDIPFAFSSELQQQEYLHYLFQEKKVFIRIRKNTEGIKRLLQEQKIAYTVISATCLAFDEKLKLDNLLPQTEDYVIQDWGTQQVGQFFQPQNDEYWWDCCAASGGKSLMLLDKNPYINLFASDVRPSILENYNRRLKQYRYDIGKKAFVHDATKPLPSRIADPFDHIICDVPCSGSGTWAQSPEQFYFFNQEKLKAFQSLQITIASNALLHLKPGGELFYITCSIWQEENEAVIQALEHTKQVTCLHQQLINTSAQGGDFIFIAKLQKM